MQYSEYLGFPTLKIDNCINEFEETKENTLS